MFSKFQQVQHQKYKVYCWIRSKSSSPQVANLGFLKDPFQYYPPPLQCSVRSLSKKPLHYIPIRTSVSNARMVSDAQH
jgi:hypothetical protein